MIAQEAASSTIVEPRLPISSSPWSRNRTAHEAVVFRDRLQDFEALRVQIHPGRPTIRSTMTRAAESAACGSS